MNADCNQDKIEIYDGFATRVPTVTICDGNKVVEFISKGNNVRMTYTGRSSDKYRGFHAIMTFI